MIEQYNQLIEKIVKEYLTKLCKDIYNEELEEGDYRIMDSHGISEGHVEYSDMYFNIGDILMAYCYNIHGKIFVSYYDLCHEAHSNKQEPGINLYDYWRKETTDSRILEIERRKELEESKESIKQSHKELKEAIKKHSTITT